MACRGSGVRVPSGPPKSLVTPEIPAPDLGSNDVLSSFTRHFTSPPKRSLARFGVAAILSARPAHLSHMGDEEVHSGGLAAACVRFGLSIVPYAPLHGGLLADLKVLEREIAGDRRYGGPGFTESEIAVARELDRLARDWGLQMYQVSLAWLLSRPAVASVIVGAETIDELRANASAADVELTPEQLDAVSALTRYI